MKYSISFKQDDDENKAEISYIKVSNCFDDEVYELKTLEELFRCFKGKTQITCSNLEYWGVFIISYLYENGYESREDDKYLKKNGTFNTLIDDNNNWYSISVKVNNSTIMFDNFTKKLGTSVEKFGKDMKLDDDENTIINFAIRLLDEKELDNLTIGSSCMKHFNKNFKYCHSFLKPVDEEEDKYIRNAYFGGLCKKSNNKQYDDIITSIDMNSMYPYVLTKYKLPVLKGKYVKGKCKTELYIQRIRVTLSLLEGKIPCLYEKGMFIGYEEIIWGTYELTLTSVDIQNMFNCYEVLDIEYVDGYEYRYANAIFNGYIKYWYENKMQAKKDKNESMYFLSKLMLNNLGGKMATKMKFHKNYIGYRDGVLTNNIKSIDSNNYYLPVAIFMCSYARKELLEAAYKLNKEIVYYDTDSLYFKGTLNDDDYKNINIDDSKLGYWKVEGTYEESIFLKQKTYYIRTVEGKEKFTMAGITTEDKKQLNKDNFKLGNTIEIKTSKRVKGGCIKTKGKFTI